MILERRSTLKPLIESEGGVHLTAYLTNTGDLGQLKRQVQKVIDKTQSEIEPVMTPIESRLFLAPLRLLLSSDRLLKSIRHNVGIFRTPKTFRVLSLPVDVDEGCVVATSFHVKPLLRWMRVDKDFLLLGIEGKTARLYLGTQHSLKLVDTHEVSEGFMKTLSRRRSTNSVSRIVVQKGAIDGLIDWLARHTRLSKPKLFVAGDPKVIQALGESLHYPALAQPSISDSFDHDQIPSLCFEIRAQLEVGSVSELEKIVTEFQFAEDHRSARRNIFQIAKAVAQGRVRKLMVADGVKIFGRFNPKTGALVIHPRDLDHEDDDILDDLAQDVLAKGGEVVVASKEDIPDGHLAWALLDHPAAELSLSVESGVPHGSKGQSVVP